MSRVSTRANYHLQAPGRQSSRAQAKALDGCQQGLHQFTPTFRPGERVCLVCSLVRYCPVCLEAHHLSPPPKRHVSAMKCAAHRQSGEVQP
jgi:hypothetical protein